MRPSGQPTSAPTLTFSGGYFGNVTAYGGGPKRIMFNATMPSMALVVDDYRDVVDWLQTSAARSGTSGYHANNGPVQRSAAGTVFWQTGLGPADFVGGHTLVAAEERALVVDNGGPQTVTLQYGTYTSVFGIVTQTMSSATVTLSEALTPIAATNSTISYLGGKSTQLQFDILATVHHGAVVVQGAQVLNITSTCHDDGSGNVTVLAGGALIVPANFVLTGGVMYIAGTLVGAQNLTLRGGSVLSFAPNATWMSVETFVGSFRRSAALANQRHAGIFNASHVVIQQASGIVLVGNDDSYYSATRTMPSFHFDQLTIADSTSFVSATGAGYVPRATLWSQNSVTALFAAFKASGNASIADGGWHSGRGGGWYPSYSGYGDSLTPSTWGAAGGISAQGLGRGMRPGYGGGALRLVVRNQVLLRGLISADGTSCVPSVDGAGTSGGGAGGSVWITVTNGPLVGPASGRISASGGDGCPNGGGGGSGGRIAVYAVNAATGYSGMFLTASGASLAQQYLTNQQYVGCYVDYTNGVRALPNFLYSNQAGYQACFDLANAQGYRYVGLEAWNIGSQALSNAGECWAGNSLITAESQGASSNCAQLGTPDGNIMWGGASAMALYDLSSVGLTSNPSVIPLYAPAGGTIFTAEADGTHGVLTAADGNARSNMVAPVTFAGSLPSNSYSSSTSGTVSAPLDLVVLTNCDLHLNTPGRSLRTTAILSLPHANCSSSNKGTTLVANTPAATTTFSYTGNVQSFVVPAGVTSISFTAVGASGGYDNGPNGSGMSNGGYGGVATGTLTVTPGSTLYVVVGGQGLSSSAARNPPSTIAGGYNGGGFSGCSTCTSDGGSGGGATDIRTSPSDLTTRLVVAGGGGGADGDAHKSWPGGNGGGLVGSSVPGEVEDGVATDAYGGSQTSGGVASSCGATPSNTAGTLGNGGTSHFGGGGGGGYYGGGGGCSSGGAGGSGYCDATLCTSVAYSVASSFGAGSVTFTYAGLEAYNGPRLTALVAHMASCRNASLVANPNPPRLTVSKGFALGVTSDLNVTGYVLDLYNATLLLVGNLSVGAQGTVRLSASTTTVVSVNSTEAIAVAHRGMAIQPAPTAPAGLKVRKPPFSVVLSSPSLLSPLINQSSHYLCAP